MAKKKIKEDMGGGAAMGGMSSVSSGGSTSVSAGITPPESPSKELNIKSPKGRNVIVDSITSWIAEPASKTKNEH